MFTNSWPWIIKWPNANLYQLLSRICFAINFKELNGRLEAQNLLEIFASLSNSTLETSIEKFAGKNFSEFKEELSELLVNNILPISGKIKKLLNDQSYLDSILLDGVEQAEKIASKKIKNIKEIVGF